MCLSKTGVWKKDRKKEDWHSTVTTQTVVFFFLEHDVNGHGSSLALL